MGFLIIDSFLDTFKTKERKGKRKVDKDDKDEIAFEECEDYDPHSSFYQMNLSRPLLKVI